MRKQPLIPLYGMSILLIFACLTVQAEPTMTQIANPSPTENAAFGCGIAVIEDLNDDGSPDFIVGAPGADRAYVISGSDLSLIRTFTHPDGLVGMRFGYAVGSAGDISNDGVEDIAIGAPGPGGLWAAIPCDPLFSDCPPEEYGRVFIFNGLSGVLIRELSPPPAFFTFGFELANLGDVNGDNLTDLGVGCPMLSRGLGQVYAFSGADGEQLWWNMETAADGLSFPDYQDIASFGFFLAPINDLDDDDKNDLLVAAPYFDIVPGHDEWNISGKVFVLSGADGSILREHLPTTSLDDGFYGGRVSSIGDQDEDGVDDYLIGHRGDGTIDLYSGLTGNLIRSIDIPIDPDTVGTFALARAGDRDGDGKEDFWVGSYIAGVVYLLNETGTVLMQVSDPGTPVEWGFGASVVSIPDLDGDGKPEILISKPGETASGMAEVGAVFLVTSNNPPEANAGVDQQVSAGLDCVGIVTLNGSGSSDPDGDPLSYTWIGPFGTATGANPQVSMPLGEHVVTLTVDDGNGGTDSDTVTITVADTTPPVVDAISVSPGLLWPPNHKMVSVAVIAPVSDNCDSNPEVILTSVTSSEPDDLPGDGSDGRTANDIQDADIGTEDYEISLRAERQGKGTGRTYTINYEAIDSSGNTTNASVEVIVPLNSN